MDAIPVKYPINREILHHPDIDSVIKFSSHLATILNALESAVRQLHPPALRQLGRALEPFEQRLADARNSFLIKTYPENFQALIARLKSVADDTKDSLTGIIQAYTHQHFLPVLLKSLRCHSRAQEGLYAIHFIAPVSRYFLEAPARPRSNEYWRNENQSDTVGVFCLKEKDKDCGYFYIPETYQQSEALPLVVALHGGSGTGREFIWFWLREARSRRFILLAPSSIDRTWSFDDSTDYDRILSSIAFIRKFCRIQDEKTLLTGFSDGAIYTLTCGLADKSPFKHLAPVSGILHPFNLENAGTRRIYLVHGQLDWMFPVSQAQTAYDLLQTYGADILFDQIENLSHTYPREVNHRILKWFNPSLSVENIGF